MSCQQQLSSKAESDICHAIDQIEVMRSIEQRYRCCDYTQDAGEVDDECRRKMVQWCFQVVEFYDIDKERVAVSLSYVDNYIGKTSDKSVLNDRKRYQLLVMTSLYLATKVYETKVIEIGLLVDLGRGTYLKEEFEEMEKDLLSTLEWRVHPPTPMTFVRQLMHIASMMNMDEKLKSNLLRLACYQIERGLFEFDMALLRPSTIAVCAILNAFDHSAFDSFPSPIKSSFIHEILRVCKIDVKTKEIEAGRHLLCHDVFPSSLYPADINADPRHPSMYTSGGSIRHSPICVGRQTQRLSL